MPSEPLAHNWHVRARRAHRKAKGPRSKTRDDLAKVLEPVTGIEPATH